MNFADDEWDLLVILSDNFDLFWFLNALNFVLFYPRLCNNCVHYISGYKWDSWMWWIQPWFEYCCNHQSVIPASSTHAFHFISSCLPSPALSFLWLLIILLLPTFHYFSMNPQRVAPGIVLCSPLRYASISYWHFL